MAKCHLNKLVYNESFFNIEELLAKMEAAREYHQMK
jgi:hypothetical protein